MKILNYLSFTCILITIGSFFLPIYESFYSYYDKQTGNIRGIVEINNYGDVNVAVINGFGSFYAMFAVFLCMLLGVGIFFVSRERAFPIVALSLFVFSLILVWMSTFNFGGPFGDKMLVGFYLSFIANGILIIISFYKVSHMRMLDKYT